MQHLSGFQQQPSGLPLTSPPLVSSSATAPMAGTKLPQGTWGAAPQPQQHLATSYPKPLLLGPPVSLNNQHLYQHQHHSSSSAQLLPTSGLSFQPRGFPQSNEPMYYQGHTQNIPPRFEGYDAGASGYSQPLLSPATQPSLGPQQNDVDRWYSQPVDQSLSPTKRGKGQKKADGKQATFLTKLYNILEQPEYNHIIRWDAAGETIIIERPEELADKILPIVYRQSRFASFSRQLNIYGWMRKVSLRNVENGIVDPDASMWSHKTLRRDSPKELILTFKRRVPPRPTQAQKNARLQNESQMLSSDSDSFNSPADPYPNHRLNDLDGRPMSSFTLDNPHLLPSVGGLMDPHNQTARGDTGPKLVPRQFAWSSSTPATAIPLHRSHQHHLMMPTGRASAQSAPATSTSFPGATSSLGFSGGSDTKLATDPLPKALLPANSTRLGPAWLGGEPRIDNSDPLLRGTVNDPTFRTDDASTWIRRGQGFLGEGFKPAAATTSAYPSSMSSSLNYNPSFAQEPLRDPLPTSSSSFSNLGKALGPSHQPTAASAPRSPVQSGTGAGGDAQSQTISPGVYSSRGLGSSNLAPPAPQANVTARTWPPRPGGTSAGSDTPPPPRSPTIVKHERRHSQSKAPYTPPSTTREANTQTNTQGPGGAIRSTHIKRSSLSHVNTTLPLPRDEEALPSANLPGQPELFGGELERKVEVVDGL